MRGFLPSPARYFKLPSFSAVDREESAANIIFHFSQRQAWFWFASTTCLVGCRRDRVWCSVFVRPGESYSSRLDCRFSVARQRRFSSAWFYDSHCQFLLALCILGITFAFFPEPPFAALFSKLMALLMVITAVGISLLGPGAFSLDGYLFGRREIIIPPGPFKR